MAKVLGIDHVSILVKDADKSLFFYQDLLNLPLLDRPDLGFSGYWLDLNFGHSLHIMELANPCSGIERSEHGGRDAHLALRVDSIKGYLKRLEQKGIKFSASKSGRKAVFFRDLDDNSIELFELSLTLT